MATVCQLQFSFFYFAGNPPIKWPSVLVVACSPRVPPRMRLYPSQCRFNYRPHPLARQADNGAFYLKHHLLDHEAATLTVLVDRDTQPQSQVGGTGARGPEG